MLAARLQDAVEADRLDPAFGGLRIGDGFGQHERDRTGEEEFAELVFSHPEYKNRSQREVV